ncbi:MAG TPA: hypothetical protein VI389_01720 [Geobacteraceae bacterium]
MSAMKQVIISSVALVAALPASAAVDQREPSGDLAVMIFLGFCALIIIAQVLPLVVRAWRRVPGQNADKAETVQEPVRK